MDISNPAAPVVRKTLDYPASDGNGATAIAVSGNVAVFGTSAGEMKVLDISNLDAPVVRASLSNFGNLSAIAISTDGHYAYLADLGASLRVVDVSSPANPVLLTTLQLPTVPWDVVLQGNGLYVAADSGVYGFDISNPVLPNLTTSYPTLGITHSLALSTNLAPQQTVIFAAEGDAGLLVLRTLDVQPPVVSITDPTSLVSFTTNAGSLNLGGSASDNVGVTRVTRSNDRGGGGQMNAPFDNWHVSGVTLSPGTNVFRVTAFDAAGNSSNATLTVIYQTPNQDQSITFPAIADRIFGDPPIQLVAAASSGLLVSFSVISGPASLSNNLLTLTGAGAVTVEADQPGDSAFNPATPVDISFNVARADQSILFAPVLDKSAGDPPFALTATTSSGLPAYFSVLSGPATINSNLITLVGGGTVTVVAWQPGDSNYNAAATVQRSFNVTKIPQTIAFGALSRQKVGDAPFPLNATASSGMPVSFSATGPVTLSGNIIAITSSGTVTVIASQAGNNTYAAATDVTQSFVVAPPDNTLVGLGFPANGGFQMGFYGIVGSNYSFEASSDLLNWQPLTNFVITDSPFYFTDPAATNVNWRFYRSVRP